MGQGKAMTNFRGVDMLGYTENESPPVGGADAEAVTAPVEEDATSVPGGSAADVLEWVGDDKDRARQALDHEKASSNPRKGLSGELEDIIK